MVDKDEDISPASMAFKPEISWSNDIKATGTQILDDGSVADFSGGGGFRYVRSEQTFNDGSNRFEIEVDFGGKEGQVSFGVSYETNLNCNGGVYYFTNAYIYCNYYPSFTKHYNNIHKTVPVKSKDKSRIAVNFSYDDKKISWEIDGQPFEDLDFDTDGKPCYVVCGMFDGKATFV